RNVTGVQTCALPIYIDNLSEFLRLMIKNEEQGLFFPQNEKYVCTSNMVKIIAEVHHKNIHLIKLFNPVLYMMVHYKVNIVNKVFGSLVYDQEMSRYKEDYNVNGFKESIVATEREVKYEKRSNSKRRN